MSRVSCGRTDEGFESLALDEDNLLEEQVPNLNGHEAVVSYFAPSPSKLRKKRRKIEENLAIDLKVGIKLM